MLNAAINTTRGVPFAPSVASKQRTEAMIAASRPTPKKKRGRRDGSKAEFALFLDESERAWKERTRDQRGR